MSRHRRRLSLAILAAAHRHRPFRSSRWRRWWTPFRTHAVVAVTAGHGESRGYAFAQLLIHDPRLIAAINDIVIEEGSARYQDVADRFVRGEHVSLESPAPRLARHHAARARL